MEWLQELVSGLVVSYPLLGTILMVLGMIMFVAQIIIPITKTKKDDKVLAKINKKPWLKKLWDFFLSFAPVQKDGLSKK